MTRMFRNAIRLLLLSCPTYRGGIHIAQSKLCSKLTSHDEYLVTPLWNGGHVKVNVNDYDGRSLFFWGSNDRKITWLCCRLLRTGDTMLDIGANFGAVGIAAARRVGQRGQVHCFEPQPLLAECIRFSADLNRLGNLSVHQAALSNRDGTRHFVIPPGHTGRGSLELSAHEGCTITVPLHHAATYLKKIGCPAARVIKLDVESHEEAVLQGATSYLNDQKPLAVIFESHDHGQPFFERGPVNILRELGYSFFQIRQSALFRVQLKAIVNAQAVETGYDFLACDTSRVKAEVRPICSIV